MENKQELLSFISPENLFTAAAVFGFVTVMLVIMIYASMYNKKRRFFSKQKINDQLNIWIGEALLEEDTIEISTPHWLQQYFRKEVHRHYVVDSLINVKKNIYGLASDNITSIYEQLELKKYSLSKLDSSKWYKKVRGIYELYMMGQRDALPSIARFANSSNESVRMEAQVAIVGFKGFGGLYFLGYLTHTMNDWQQLKLLEQLSKLDPENMPDLPNWLTSSNDYVKLFALKLADIYHQFHVYGLVVNCLQSRKDNVRAQAIKTLGRIANESTPGTLKVSYGSETNINKKIILKQLSDIGTEEDVEFLLSQLADDDDSIKLEAGRAIAKCSSNSWELLFNNIKGDETLLAISKQIKYELAR